MGRCTLSITDVVRVVVACRMGGVQNAVRPILQNVMVQSSEKFTAFQVRSPWQAPFSLEFKSLQNHLWKDKEKELQEEHEAYHFPFRHFHSAFA